MISAEFRFPLYFRHWTYVLQFTRIQTTITIHADTCTHAHETRIIYSIFNDLCDAVLVQT